MKLRSKLRQVAGAPDENIVNVARMAGGVAQTRNAGDFGNTAQKLAQRPCATEAFTMIGIDVLTDQRHLAHACLCEVPYFVEDFFDRPRDFRAARVRHDTEG